MNGKDPVKLKYNDHGAYLKYHQMKKTLTKIQNNGNVSQEFIESVHKEINIEISSLVCDIQEMGEDEPRISPTSVIQDHRERSTNVVQDMPLRGEIPDNVGVFFNQESDRTRTGQGNQNGLQEKNNFEVDERIEINQVYEEDNHGQTNNYLNKYCENCLRSQVNLEQNIYELEFVKRSSNKIKKRSKFRIIKYGSRNVREL